MYRTSSSKRYLAFIAMAFLAWVASYVFTTEQNDKSLHQLVAESEGRITELELELNVLALDLLNQVKVEKSTHWNTLDELIDVDGRYVLFAHVWSAPAHCLDVELPEKEGVGALQLADGVYLHSFKKDELHSVHVLQLIYNDPAYENRYLKKVAHPSLNLDPALELQREPGKANLHSSDGSFLCGVEWREANNGRMISWQAWLLRILALFFLLAPIWWVCRLFAEGFSPTVGIAIAVLICGLLAFLVPQLFEESGELFDPALYATSSFLGSLGHLLIVSILSILLALFVGRLLESEEQERSLLAMGLTMAVLLFIGRVISLMIIGLVMDSTIDLNLFEIEHFGVYSLVAIISSAMLLGAWSILAYSMMTAWWPEGWSRNVVIVFVGFILLSISAHHFIGTRDTLFMFWPIVVLLILFSFGRFPLAKALLTLVVLAVFNAHVLNKYTSNREERDRVVTAERLAQEEDPILERLFSGMANKIQNDPEVIRLLSDTIPCPIQEVEARIRSEYFSGGFWERYSIRTNVFDANNSFRCDIASSNSDSWNDLYTAFSKGYDVSGVEQLHMADSSKSAFTYIASFDIPHDTSGLSGYVFMRFTPRSAPEELGFPELLLAGEDAIDTRIRRYAYAEYMLRTSGAGPERMRQFGSRAYPLEWATPIKAGPNWRDVDGFKELAYLNGNVLVVMSTVLPSLLDKATTFSYLFMFFVLLALIIGVIWWRSSQDKWIEWNLRSKVRTTLLFFVLIGSLLFGLGARKLLVDSFSQSVDNDLREKTHSILLELRGKVGDLDELDESAIPKLDYYLRKFSKVFFSDITLYDLDGKLLASSRPQLFEAKLIGKRMAPNAYRALAIEGISEFIHNERIGELTYRSAYVPFLNEQGRVTAYLDLPYFARQYELDSALSGLLVAIVNLFVLLFALSMIAAVFISNWTTRPLSILERNLSKIDLESTNTPLKYTGRDEIGRLVEVYNTKVDELRESAERLARSERESAWREMAKQVAHEIKNPLTPMKLSVQHFERTWDPHAEGAEERKQKFSKGLVDQIDTLSRIAEEFSHFAKLPPSRPEKIDLRDSLSGAIDLFRNVDNCKIELEAPSEINTVVYADPDHMVRVFNNLIKNAMEAIPDEREGHILLEISNVDTGVQVAITDNGNGISDEIRDRIFTPNFTTRSTGMGLGLAMVKRMVEGGGGKVWFESTTNQGTTFYVALPNA